MKKFVSIILILALVLGIAAFAFAEEGQEMQGTDDIWVRVGLYYGDNCQSSVTLKSAHGFLVCTGGRDGYTVIDSESLIDTTELTVKAGDFDNTTILMSAAEDPEERIIEIGGYKYRDGVFFNEEVEGKLAVINFVSLEHYTRAVTASEINSVYPVEAMKAQAVAARSYAIANFNKHSSKAFDLCNTTDCQGYKGVRIESSAINNAVADCAGVVAAYDGKIATTFYYAASGGWTVNIEDVWTQNIPYLRAVKDEFVSEYKWNTSISFADLKAKMIAVGYDCGDITSVEVSKRLESGAVYQLLVHTTNGDCTITKNNVTRIVGSSVLPSVFFSMAGTNEVCFEKETRGGLSIMGEGGRTVGGESVYVLDGDGQLVEMAASEMIISNGPVETLAETAQTSEYVFTDEIVSGGTLYFAGLGRGHSVGMPQTSIRTMGNAGYSYEEILNYYYQGIDLVQVKELGY